MSGEIEIRTLLDNTFVPQRWGSPLTGTLNTVAVAAMILNNFWVGWDYFLILESIQEHFFSRVSNKNPIHISGLK